MTDFPKKPRTIDPRDARRCDGGRADHWGNCFACGAQKMEPCLDPKPAPGPVQVAEPNNPPLKRCPVCRGRGALRCDCWPGDCICGWDDEPCDNCEGTGFLDPYFDDDHP